MELCSSSDRRSLQPLQQELPRIYNNFIMEHMQSSVFPVPQSQAACSIDKRDKKPPERARTRERGKKEALTGFLFTPCPNNSAAFSLVFPLRRQTKKRHSASLGILRKPFLTECKMFWPRYCCADVRCAAKQILCLLVLE